VRVKTVTASVTEVIRGLREKTKPKEGLQSSRRFEERNIEPSRPSQDQTSPDQSTEKQSGSTLTLGQGREGVTHGNSGERDSGTAPGERSALTGKLCRRVMALIRWQCGADGAVDERMVRALEGWLRRRGISIYTDLV
jgi:hypothetical protein